MQSSFNIQWQFGTRWTWVFILIKQHSCTLFIQISVRDIAVIELICIMEFWTSKLSNHYVIKVKIVILFRYFLYVHRLYNIKLSLFCKYVGLLLPMPYFHVNSMISRHPSLNSMNGPQIEEKFSFIKHCNPHISQENRLKQNLCGVTMCTKKHIDSMKCWHNTSLGKINKLETLGLSN